jgi:hypothetical protein
MKKDEATFRRNVQRVKVLELKMKNPKGKT